MKRVYLVRHGQTVGNLERFFQDFDTPLTSLGHKQAEVVADRVSHLDIDSLVVSPMLRAQQTAKPISKLTGLEIETCEHFHERLQPLHIRGKSKIEGEGLEYAEKYEEYYRNNAEFEGFENFTKVTERALEAVTFLENHSGSNILVVAHSAFIHSLAAFLLLNKSDDVAANHAVDYGLSKLSNAGISEFGLKADGRWELITWNDNAHFAE